MIALDQPTIFNKRVIAAVSSVDDGNMKFGIQDQTEVVENRERFLEKAGLSLDATTLVSITYDTDSFTKYKKVSLDEAGVGMRASAQADFTADALVTTTKAHALFLPLADCVGAIIFDPTKDVLMVSHLGRHSAEQFGAVKSVEFLKHEYEVNPVNLQVWLSPSVGQAAYPVHAFNNQGLEQIITDQLVNAGVNATSIESGHIDTSQSQSYFSHSEFKKGQGIDGRFAIVASIV